MFKLQKFYTDSKEKTDKGDNEILELVAQRGCGICICHYIQNLKV